MGVSAQAIEPEATGYRKRDGTEGASKKPPAGQFARVDQILDGRIV
jgi:hypothetical protein